MFHEVSFVFLSCSSWFIFKCGSEFFSLNISYSTKSSNKLGLKEYAFIKLLHFHELTKYIPCLI